MLLQLDKINREVRLSTVDSDERFTYDTCDDPELFFTVKDWSLFYNYVWRDLKDGCDEPSIYRWMERHHPGNALQGIRGSH